MTTETYSGIEVIAIDVNELDELRVCQRCVLRAECNRTNGAFPCTCEEREDKKDVYFIKLEGK